MGKINLLTEEVANLIAAGEVVDRPASVLKELLENAIDAGATKVTAEISHGGVSLLSVSDNGCGIASEDLPVALQRHATSKIRNAEDLDEILTLGFRGEALAAIAGVSVLEIVTRTRDADVGTLLRAEYGRIVEVSEVGCREGTTVAVRELFGNVPARRKFLKKDVTEAAASVAYAEKLALAHPEVALTMIVDGTVKFSTAGDGDVLAVLYALEGREFAKKMLPVKGELAGMSLSGYVGRSDSVVGTRNHQNFYINGRYIRSKTMQAALEQAFTSYIAPGKFPVATLFLTIAPGAVDVNVHPAKLEVRFSNERTVFELVYHAVRGALTAASYRPELSGMPQSQAERAKVTPQTAVRESLSHPIRMELPRREAAAPAKEGVGAARPIPPRASAREDLSPRDSLRVLADYARQGAEAPRVASNTPFSYEREEGTPSEEKGRAPSLPPEEKVGEAASFRIVGEAFSTYVLIEEGDRLLVIDKHAAHERILFEELLAEQRASGAAASQVLLFPLSPRLSETERASLAEYRADMEAAGFFYRISEGEVLLEAIPSRVSPDAAEALFAEMAASLSEGTGDPAITEAVRRERTLWQVACKAAIKGGRLYDEAHIRWLCERVLSMPDITVCPHGRPIAFALTKHWLDREFNRIQH